MFQDDMTEAVFLLVVLGVQVLWRLVGKKWWGKPVSPPLQAGDLVAYEGTPRVYEVLSHPRPGFVAVRCYGRAPGGGSHPILVVHPASLVRVRGRK